MTLLELSRELGVSVATVSNALTGKGRMRPEKRQQIIETAIAFGYDIQSVQTRQRKKNVYIIVEQVENAPTPPILDSICKAAMEADVNAYIINLNLLDIFGDISPDNEKVREIVRPAFQMVSGSANGIIYLSQYPRDLTGVFPKVSLPFVIAYSYTSEDYTCINYDDASGAYIATKHLIDCGCRSIAMISGPINSLPMTKRLSGYQRALIDSGLSFDPRLIQLGNWLPESSYHCAQQLMKMGKKPDAIFCQSDRMAVGAMRAIQDMGLRIPDDIAIAGFDNTDFCEYLTPSLTSIVTPFREIGKTAFDQLIKLISNNKSVPISIKVPCKIVVRDSSRSR